MVTSKGALVLADAFEAMTVVRKWPAGDEENVVTDNEDVNGDSRWTARPSSWPLEDIPRRSRIPHPPKPRGPLRSLNPCRRAADGRHWGPSKRQIQWTDSSST